VAKKLGPSNRSKLLLFLHIFKKEQIKRQLLFATISLKTLFFNFEDLIDLSNKCLG